MTLTGNGVGRATAVLLPEPGLAATILPAAKPDPNRLEVDLTIAADARVGLHAIGVITPLGVPGFQTFAVAADPEVAEQEPNDRPDPLKDQADRPARDAGRHDRPARRRRPLPLRGQGRPASSSSRSWRDRRLEAAAGADPARRPGGRSLAQASLGAGRHATRS